MLKILLVFSVLFLMGTGCASDVPNPVMNVKTDTDIKVTTISVAKVFNGNDGYSLSIPSGNQSTCIWTWVGGTAQVPDTRTTLAISATQKHLLNFDHGVFDSLSNFKVTCIDDFGNRYVGAFPAT